MSDEIIFILPFAGGSVYSMAGLVEELEGIDVCILELPGRGKRIKEALLTNMEDMITDLLRRVELQTNLYKEYYVYGHSMGALLAYVLIRQMRDLGCKLPAHLFVSGRGGPSLGEGTENIDLLSSDEFWKVIKELGGCPEGLLQDEKLMNFFEPILKADFKAVESFKYSEAASIGVPITCFFGSKESISIEERDLWRKESGCGVEIIELPGDHFFIFSNWAAISTKIMHVRNSKGLCGIEFPGNY